MPIYLLKKSSLLYSGQCDSYKVQAIYQCSTLFVSVNPAYMWKHQKAFKHVYIYCYQSNVTKLYKVWLTSHVDYTFSVLTKNLFHVVPVPSHSSPTLIYSEKKTRFLHASGSIILVALKSLKSIKWNFTSKSEINN